jgi:hypothetical protein
LTTAGSSVLATAIPAPAIAALLSCNQVEPPRRRAAVAAAMTASPSSSPMAGVGTVVGSASSAGIDADSEGTALADGRNARTSAPAARPPRNALRHSRRGRISSRSVYCAMPMRHVLFISRTAALPPGPKHRLRR